MLPKPVIELTGALATAAEAGTVLVANQGLKRHLLDGFNARQIAQGHNAWPTPRIHVVDDWLAGHYRRLRTDGDPAARPRLLDAPTQRLLWLQNVPERAPDGIAPLYPLVRSAWELLHDYRLEMRLDEFADNENTRLFRDWSMQFRAAAHGRWRTMAELNAVLAAAADRLADSIHGPIVWLGPTSATPALQSLFDELNRTGVAVEAHEPAPAPAAQVHQYRCEDTASEFARATAWARETWLAAEGPVSIGIAVPDVVDRYDAITRQLDATFVPGRVDEESLTRPYNVSGGIRLADHPCVRAGLEFLRWLTEPLSQDRARALLTSPFLAFRDRRVPISPLLPESFTFSTLASTALASRASDDRLSGVLRSLSTAPRLAPITAWIDHFDGSLAAAGWPGDAEDSALYQATQDFRELFEQSARLAPLTDVLTAADALALLEDLAADRLFSPKRPTAPVQVVAHDESTVMRFTHLWIAGLSERDWPGQSRTNPLLPLRLQREAGVAQCDADAQYRHGRETLRRWHTCADLLVFSAPSRDVDEVLTPTPLLPTGAWTEDPRPCATHPFIVANPRGALEHLEDRIGPRVTASTAQASNTLRDQARCAFRAFAIQRLEVAPIELPHSLPDARERGILVHDALRIAYQDIPDQVTLHAMSPDRRRALASDAAGAAVDTWARRYPQRIREIEVRRLTERVLEWFEVDAARPRFTIIGHELDLDAVIGTLPLRLRIDRVDQVGQAGHDRIVLDYKTGPADVRSWSPESLTEPQLPLYAEVVEGARGIGFARLTAEQTDLVGVCAAPDQMEAPGVRMSDPTTFEAADWSTLATAWRQRLHELAAAFVAGNARVAPEEPSICQTCHLKPLCRIAESR